MYTREQVEKATLKYFKGDELATTVWMDKYCLRTKQKYFELTPDDMHRRLAKEFARIEAKYPEPMEENEIYNLLKDFKYIVPQGSPMKGIGNQFSKTSISNCFVIGGQPDSYGGIHHADEEQTQLMKRRGGVGQDLSHLRPSGSDANGEPLGPNAGMPLYMDRYSNSTREVQQDGRRGALMLSVSIKHPDAEKFIDKKLTPGAVTGANISVKITDEFYECLENDKPFIQTYPIGVSIDSILGHPIGARDEAVDWEVIIESFEKDTLHTGKCIEGVQTYFKIIDPNVIWDKMVYNAWKSAEPGALFWDKILNESPAKGYGLRWLEKSTNPCAELPLPPYDSCRLLLVNLSSYIYNAFSKNAMLEDTLLVDHVKKAQRLMDDMVDLEIEKIDQIIEDIDNKAHGDKYQRVEKSLWTKIRQMAVDGRRTGLGITGGGDLIAKLGLTYGTPEATAFSEKLHQLFATAAYESSIELAQQRGAFPIWDIEKDTESNFLRRMFTENDIMDKDLRNKHNKIGRRNIAILTIAPAGSVSILTQTSSGVEPIFSPYYFRKKKITTELEWDYVDEVGDKWVEFPVFHKPFIEWYSVKYTLPLEVAEYDLERFTKSELDELFEASPYYKATAQDVDYVEKVRMQGAIQKWVDHSISVTVNMPEDVTVEIIDAVYREAYKSGCKGVTVYRDNSRGNVLSTASVKDRPSGAFEYISATKRPGNVGLDCDIFFKTKAGEDYVVLVGKLEEKPYEIFVLPDNDKTNLSKSKKRLTINKRKKGFYDLVDEDGSIILENITSYMIESEQNSTRNFSAMLRHRMDPKFIVDLISRYASISSFHKVIGKVLKTYIEDPAEGDCPDCGGKMIMTEGCMKCPDCGYAHCG